LILGNPDKYDAAIRGWIEENHSKDWHLQWRSFIKLPIFNEPEVIEPLKTVWKARYRFWVTAYGKFFGVTEDRVNSKMKKIAATTSLDGLLK
jgi:hypothetical protein